MDDIFVADFNSFETIPKKKRRIKSFLLQMNHGNVCHFDLSCIDFKIFSEYLASKKHNAVQRMAVLLITVILC